MSARMSSGPNQTVVLGVVLVLLAALGVLTLLFVPKQLILIGFAATVATAGLLWVAANTLFAGKLENLLILWALFFPLGYYFLSFPREKTVITLDRAVVMLAALSLLLAAKSVRTRVPTVLHPVVVMWIAFIAAASVSLFKVSDTIITGPVRILVESFALPGMLGWCVIAGFRVRDPRYQVRLHQAVCVAAVYCGAIGAMEMIEGQDLLPLPGAGIYYAGSDIMGMGATILRPNGPFLTNHSFSLIGLISFFLLLFLYGQPNLRRTFFSRALHYLGLAACLAMTLMPLYRSVMITLVLVGILELVRRKGWAGRGAHLATAVVALLVVFQVFSAAPEQVKSERLSSNNIYGRVAQDLQTLTVFASAPTLGVGFGNYGAAIVEHPVAATFNGVGAVDAPHNTFMEILAETGILGALPFLLAQWFLVKAFLQIRNRRTPESMVVWRTFLYVFLTYWITGLSLGSGYSADLNMWYIFALSLLWKFSMTESRPLPAVQRSWADRDDYGVRNQSQPVALGTR
jgi:hypothetical protein